MHRKGESKGLSATWWQVQESVRQRLRSGTITLLARRRGAHKSGLPEGGSSMAAAASAPPGASTDVDPAWGACFSCKGGQKGA